MGAQGTWCVLEGVSCDWVGAGRIFFVLIVCVGGCSREFCIWKRNYLLVALRLPSLQEFVSRV